MRRRTVVLGALSALACVAPTAAPGRPSINMLGTTGESRSRMVRDLQAAVLLSYTRPDSLAFETSLVTKGIVDPTIGPAWIGVGPADVRFGGDAKVPMTNRWPFDIARDKSQVVVSKRLEVHLSSDHRPAAAWTSDEVSWQVQVCGKTAAIPLRVTALYAHDGYQWFEVLEHVSYGMAPSISGELRGARITDAFTDPQLVDYPLGELGAPLAAILSGDLARMRQVVSIDPSRRGASELMAPTFLLGPDPGTEWHGHSDVALARLRVAPIWPEDRRVGMIGLAKNVAYWVGNFIAELPPHPPRPGGQVRLRGTFVFEKRCAERAESCRPDTWFVVQGHVSAPIEDAELARRVFGASLQSSQPLRFDCAGHRAPRS